MRINSVQIRRFRSVEASGLDKCGGLNILIGKNNAGKSNILSAIELVMFHLRRGNLAGSWPAGRVREEFTDRELGKPLQIGIEFELPAELNDKLRADLIESSPHLEKSIEQIRNYNSAVFILAGALEKSAFLYLEQMGVGKLVADASDLQIEGMKLLTTKQAVGYELYRKQEMANELRDNIEIVKEMLRNPSRLERGIGPKGESFYWYDIARRAPREFTRQIQSQLATAENLEQATAILSQSIATMTDKADAILKRETSEALTAFAGDTKTAPIYSERLMKAYGSLAIIHFRESKQQIGREEAETLLNLKVRRGGPERLEAIQQTIRGLLGVHVDAFQADQSSGEARAEMDVDQFLVEANGAGIREALRIVLDLELKPPKLVLIEEPEVHLHPGLARLVAGYLREKSRDIQMFVTTHSTEFVDSVSFQNAYLVSRDARKRTVCQLVEATEAIQRIPTELGLRLSTVFMFDRLIFVEGPSDEGVIREFAQHLGYDLTKSNAGFVHMGGIRNFAHFAAEGTLELLSRRRILMWFLSDRDEREDEEVSKMADRLGDRAKLVVLNRRELENYLLDPEAVAAFIKDKQKLAGLKKEKIPDRAEVVKGLNEVVGGLQQECVRLRIFTRLLKPIFLNIRTCQGSAQQRIEEAKMELDQRHSRLAAEEERISAELAQKWGRDALAVVPGALVLEKLAERFGISFSKSRGDSELLASYVTNIPNELTSLLREVVGEDSPVVSH